jgi:translation initiation factor 1A
MNIKKGGKKGKKMKKDSSRFDIKRDLQTKQEDQCYAQAIKLLGDCRVELQCFDGMKRVGHIRGSMKNKVWITVGDVLLVGLRDFQDAKCDIILKYSAEETRSLRSHQEIPTSTKINESGIENTEENSDQEKGGFSFEDI